MITDSNIITAIITVYHVEPYYKQREIIINISSLILTFPQRMPERTMKWRTRRISILKSSPPTLPIAPSLLHECPSLN